MDYSINNIININNNDFLLTIINQLEQVINDLNNNKQLNNIINQIKNIIILMNKFILDNKNNIESIKKENKEFHNNIIEKFDELKIDISKNNENQIQNIKYNKGKYVGEIKNNMKNVMGYSIMNLAPNGLDMKENGKMVNKKEKAYCITQRVISMKGNGKMVKKMGME